MKRKNILSFMIYIILILFSIGFVSAEEKQMDIITTYNKWFIEKYNQKIKEIEREKEILKKLKELEEEERKREIKKYQEHIKRYIKIDDLLNKSKYIIFLRLNIDWLNFIEYKWKKYIFYIKPIYLKNEAKATKIEKNFKKDLESLFKINDIIKLKEKVKQIEEKYSVKNFYKLFTMDEFMQFFSFSFWRLSDEKIPIEFGEDIKYFNSLYYIPDKLSKYINNEHIYFYFPINREYISRKLQTDIDKFDFNKSYCAWIKYDDGFYFADSMACIFKNYNKYWWIIWFDFDSSKNMLILERINLKIINRWNELIDIAIIVAWVVLAFIVKAFLNFLRKEKEQHEQDVL